MLLMLLMLLTKLFLRIVAVWETGLLDFWNIRTPSKIVKCLKREQKPEKVTLGMRHLSSAFILLIAGYILSICALFLEMMAAKLRQRVFVL